MSKFKKLTFQLFELKNLYDVYIRIYFNDITQDEFPNVDLLFCRDCLFHLSFQDINLVINNIARSNIKYILTTSFVQGSNHDINTGEFRELSFEEDPYNFDKPIDAIDDYIEGTVPRRMCLWARSTFENYLK